LRFIFSIVWCLKMFTDTIARTANR